MKLNEYRNVYFIGAGGIGMAALERYCLAMGQRVAGYDRTPSPLTAELIAEGVAISYVDSLEAIPEDFRDPATTLAVWTPAVPHDSVVLTFFREGGFRLLKRAALLGEITRTSKGLCFAGTHGKTTTSSMAAHVMHHTKADCNAFLGGIMMGDYHSNLILAPKSEYSVIEADEYDRSFHHLTPYVAVINATDPDHLDIYGTEDAYLESFAHFTELIRPDGALLVHTGLKLVPRPADGVRVYTFSRDEGDFHAENIRRSEGAVTFDLVHPGGVIRDITPGIPVDINIDNSIAALGACLLTGELDDDTARRAIASYPGVERRFQYHLRQPGRVVIDDYAHHPDELRQSISSVRKLYPNRKLTVAFQPHLFSRTRDFYREFAQALSMADSVALADIYPAREEPIPGVTSQIIFDLVDVPDKVMIRKDDFVETMLGRDFEVLLAVGAGDLSFEVPKLCEHYK